MKYKDTDKLKVITSLDYNMIFNKETGFTARWGKTKDDDPDYCKYGPELADIEISSAAPNDVADRDSNMLITEGGCNGVGCKKFCYKGNVSNQTIHMSLQTICEILDKMPETLCQVAYGICSVDSHPELEQIFIETRKRGIIPNITCNGVGVTDEAAEMIAKYCGAIAVSVNPENKEMAYDTIKLLSQDYGMTQANIHIVLAEDSVDFIKDVMYDMRHTMFYDERLDNLNALVMLSFKDKAATGCMKPITQDNFNSIVNHAEHLEVPFGFDSCAAHMYLKCIEGRKNEEQLAQNCEPCESLLFSCYINVFGIAYACSFTEKMAPWQEGIDVLKCDSFMDVWNSDKAKGWRKFLINNDRKCPCYDIGE